MSESFVDLAYRGLPLGRRIKLTQIRPSTGFLELSAPMPVGTKIALATDDGVAIDAVVTQIHEQIGGSDRTPGMTVVPSLADAAAAAWWQQRVALPELEVPEPRSVMVHPRAHTPTGSPPPVPAAAPAAPAAAAPAAAEPAPAEAEAAPPAEAQPAEPADAEAAGAEPADAEAAGAEPAGAEAEPEAAGAEPAGAEAEPEAADQVDEAGAPLVDDGKRTVMMHSVDLHALGLESGASGQLSASAVLAAADEADGGDGEGEGDGDGGGAGDAAATADAGGDGEPRPPAGPEGDKRPAGRKRKKRR